MRLIESAYYADVAVAVYMKVKALGQRSEGCTAGTAVLASYLGLSRSSVERGIAQLRRPAPDGVVELPHSRRRSLPGGCGTTAQRRVRRMRPDERYIWLPVAACEDLTPRQLRAYAVLSFAQVQNIPLTEGELACYLRHYSGIRAGSPISAAAAGKVVDGLEATEWITVERRAGARGRHHFTAHHVLPSPVDAAPAKAGADAATSRHDDGSGASSGEGSLATREDHRTDRPDDEHRPHSPAVGEVQVEEASLPVHNSASHSQHLGADGDLALRAGENRSRPRPRKVPTQPAPYGGPGLTLHPRIAAVLEPVRALYQRANTFMQRRIAKEVGRQLDLGCDAERLRHRLASRFAGVMVSEIKDPARWLMGVALPRWGCGHQTCESGVMWPSGEPCAACADVLASRRWERLLLQRIELGQCPDHGSGQGDGSCGECAPPPSHHPSAGASPQPPPGPARALCGDCGCRIALTGAALADGLCKPCRILRAPANPEPQEPAHAPARCVGWRDEYCDRVALPSRRVCARHRAKELQNEAAG